MRNRVVVSAALGAAALAWLACVGDNPEIDPQGAEAGTGDDAGDASTDTVAESAGGRCDPSKGFLAPIVVEGVSSAADEDSARLTADELTIFFTRGTGAASAIYSASRGTPDAAFSNVALVQGGINADGAETPSPNADGTLLYYVPTGLVAPSLDIFLSTKSAGGFPAGAPLPSPVTQPVNERHPFMRADGKMLYFTTNLNDPEPTMYRSVFETNFGEPVSVSVPADAGNPHVFPAATADGRTIFFGQANANGRLRIHTARGASFDAIGAAGEVVELNDPQGNHWPTWISGDGCVLYFRSDRPNGPGQGDIWVAKRPPP